MKPYKIIPPVQVYALNIEAECTCENCPPQYAEHIVEEDGNYYITLNGINQSDYDLQCMQGDIIQMYITHDKVISTLKRPDKDLENYRLIIKDESLSNVQTLILLIIHLLFIAGIPITLISLVNNIWIEILVFSIWWFTLEYTSSWIQHNITNKIFKLIYNGK